MALVNRDKDVSEQRDTLQYQFGAVATGVTLMGPIVPYTSELSAIRFAATGLSGTPTYAFTIGRFVVGSGYTAITGGCTTTTAAAIGTSGVVTVPQVATGNTLIQLQPGDQFQIVSAGSNAAVVSLQVAFVIKSLSDIKSQFGL